MTDRKISRNAVQNVRDQIDRTGFVYADLSTGARITAWGARVPGEERKARVTVRKGSETLDSVQVTNNAVAARRVLQFMEKHDPEYTAPREREREEEVSDELHPTVKEHNEKMRRMREKLR